MSGTNINAKLDEIDKKLAETEEAAGYGRGMHQDILKMVVPALKDLAEVIRDIKKELDRKEPI